MKSFLLKFELVFTSLRLLRTVVSLINFIFHRIFWVWGRLRFGALVPNREIGCVCHWTVELKYPSNLFCGKNVVLGPNVVVGALSRVRLGDNVRVSKGVLIETATLDFHGGAKAPYSHLAKPIVIEADVWVGAGSIILGGVTIGKGSVVAAGSLVTKSIPSNTVVGGNPAKVIKIIEGRL